MTSPLARFAVGSLSGSHLQMSGGSLNSYSKTAGTSGSADTLNLNNNGGRINLGSDASTIIAAGTLSVGDLSVPSRTIRMGTNKVYFGYTFPTPVSDNDWFFDHVNQRIMVRNGSAWKVLAS